MFQFSGKAFAASVLLLGCALLSACSTNNVQAVKAAPVDRLANAGFAGATVELAIPNSSLTLQATLQQKMKDSLSGCLSGSQPTLIHVRIDAYKEQNGAMTMLIGDNTQLNGKVSVLNPADKSVLGEYYISEATGGGGLIAMAAMANAEANLSGRFADRVCNEVFNKKPAN